MSNSAVDGLSGRAKPAFRALPKSAYYLLVRGFAASLAWAAAALITAFWADQTEGDWVYTGDLGVIFGAVAVIIAAMLVIPARSAALRRLDLLVPWLSALGLLMVAWE